MTPERFTQLYEMRTQRSADEQEVLETLHAYRIEVEVLKRAILEASRHLLGKCECADTVSCAAFATQTLNPFVEVGSPPEYEHRLRSATASKLVDSAHAPTQTSEQSCPPDRT